MDTGALPRVNHEYPTPAPGSLTPRLPNWPTPLSLPHQTAITALLVVRWVKYVLLPDPMLFPVWRHHLFFTNSDLPATKLTSPTANTNAIIETVFADPDRRPAGTSAVRRLRR